MVRNIFRTVLGASALIMVLSASPALADKGGIPHHERERGRGRHHAPEFDIAAAGAVAAIVAGGGVLLARRRRT